MDKEVIKVKWELEIPCNFEDNATSTICPHYKGFGQKKKIDKQASFLDSRQICK